MEADSSITIEELRVDGGATANDLLMQFQSDILGTKVVKPGVTEVTAIGAAYLAGIATGYWKSVEEIRDQWKVHRAFTASNNLPTEELIDGWKRAVEASKRQQLTIH
jgi:glycerol kinase